MQTILVTGGAGFIGSHACLVLLENNFRVVVLDSFINGSLIALKKVKEIVGMKNDYAKENLYIFKGDLRDQEVLNKLFNDCNQRNMPIEAVLHFAGLKAVSDSLKNPKEYWDVNVNGSLRLFKTMEKYKCTKIVYSSSATVYDHSSMGLMSEDNAIKPTNPYGETKLEVEKILKRFAVNKPSIWRSVILRYFNPIGAHPSGMIGEDPQKKATNLFPLIIEAASSNKRILEIYGNDWPTCDGTCIRDFIHVMDLAEAHLASLIYIQKSNPNYSVLNVGTGKGTTLLELIKIFEKVNNCKIPYKFVKRRDGDIPQSIADNSMILKTLDWINKRNLEDMCIDGWSWKQKNPKGYLN